MSKDKLIQVRTLTDGRFVVTITSTEIRFVDAKQLRDMGLTPPSPLLPWTHEKPREVSKEEREAMLSYWTERLGELDRRLPDRSVVFLREHGLDGMRQAIDQVAATTTGTAEQKYVALVRVLRQMQERAEAKP